MESLLFLFFNYVQSLRDRCTNRVSPGREPTVAPGFRSGRKNSRRLSVKLNVNASLGSARGFFYWPPTRGVPWALSEHVVEDRVDHLLDDVGIHTAKLPEVDGRKDGQGYSC